MNKTSYSFLGVCVLSAFLMAGCAKKTREAVVLSQSTSTITETAEKGLRLNEIGCSYSTQSIDGDFIKFFEFSEPISLSKIKSQIILTHPELEGLEVDSQDRYLDIEDINGNETTTFYTQLDLPKPAVINGQTVTIDIPESALRRYESIKMLPSRYSENVRVVFNLRLMNRDHLIAAISIVLTDRLPTG